MRAVESRRAQQQVPSVVCSNKKGFEPGGTPEAFDSTQAADLYVPTGNCFNEAIGLGRAYDEA